jgi:hypothetical protein
MKEYLADISKKSRVVGAGYREGFEATVVALKANEAILNGSKIHFKKEWFDLG